MATRGLLRERKFNRRHRNVIAAAEVIIEAAKKHKDVSKVVLGPIARLPSGSMRLKFAKIPAGIAVTVRGTTAKQLIYIYTNTQRDVEQELESAWLNART